MGALGLGLGLPFTQARSGGAAVTLSSLLAEAGAADWDISVAASLKQNSDGTTAVASTDPIGYIADQTGHGLHLTQATAGKRMTLSSRITGIPMVQSDCNDDCYDLPAGLAAAGGTFAFASAHGEPQCYWVAQRDQLPHAQFGRACWFPRALSSDERTAVLAGLGAIFDTTHTLETLDTGLTLSAYFASANLYTSLDDASSLGATVSLNLQTSTDVGPFPPWDTSGYYSTVTCTAREWADITTTAADIESIELGYWIVSNVLGRAFDTTDKPNLKVWAQSHKFEGQFPPVADWPADVEYVSLSATGLGPARLTGAHPTGAELATRPSLRGLFWETDTDGAMPSMAGLPALQSFGFGRRQPWTLESGWAVPSTVKFCTFGNQVGTTAASVVNAILAAFRAAAVTGCTINLQTGMAAPSGQGLTDKQWLIDHGANTVNTN